MSIVTTTMCASLSHTVSSIGFLITVMIFPLTFCQPQCFDGFAPFKLEAKDVFCSQYRQSGCCSTKRDNQIMFKYLHINQELNKKKLTSCSEMVKQILCQECSPYSAKMYELEIKSTAQSFPGLCTSYCRQFYSSCRDVIQYLTNDSKILSSLNSMDKFCSTVSHSDKKFCFPDVNNNDELNRALERKTSSSDDCLCLKELTKDLDKPLTLSSPDDGSKRIFLGTQDGKIFIYYENGTRLKDHFMDLSDIVVTSSFRGDQRGLLGLAFHSNFKATQKFYVHFTMKNIAGSGEISRISEFKTLKDNVNKADIASMRTIIDIDQPSAMNNAGQLIFGIDGFLYALLGDGQGDTPKGKGDPLNHGQNRSTLLGSIIRINVDTTDSKIGYTIPLDNPFIGQTNVKPEIFAYGFRNPVRGDQDEGDPVTGYGRGRIFVGDVGKDSWEEINQIHKGGNYGWSAKEGTRCYKEELCTKLVSDVHPIFEYNHSVGRAVQGGHVYRGCLNPSLNGLYFYGDYFHGKIFRLKETSQGSGVWDNKEVSMCKVCPNGWTNKYQDNILGFGEDYDGEIYVITNGGGTATSGRVYKLVDPKRRGDPATCRSNKNKFTIVDVAQTITIEKEVMPKWPYWMMMLASIMGFVSGVVCFYSLLRYCPQWAPYRRLVHANIFRERNGRVDQNLDRLCDSPSGL